MTQDPLSIPTTVLPESTFDPVQFAKERRQEVLTEQKDRRERYNKAWESVGTPAGMNRNVQQELIARRNQILEEGANKSAEGIDITDISHPKYGRDAMEFRSSLDQLNMDISKTEAIDKLLGEARNMIAKDDKGVIDVNATNSNIAKIRSAKNLDEIDQFLSSKGDSIIELKPKQFDMDQYIVDYMKDKGIKGMNVSSETPKGNFLITEQYNEIPPEELQSAFMGMLQNPDFRNKVKEMRASDATDLRGGSDLEYLMERKGNRLARQQTGLKREWIKPDKSDKPEEKKYSFSNEPVETLIGKYKAVGRNVVTFKQQKPMKVTAGESIVDIESGSNKPISEAITFTPINTAEYYVLNTNKSGAKAGTILTDTDISRGTRFKPEDYEAKRFVEGTYPIKKKVGDKTVDATKTVLVPYENIKNELDAEFKLAGDIPQTKNEIVRYTKEGKAAIFDATTKKFIRWAE